MLECCWGVEAEEGAHCRWGAHYQGADAVVAASASAPGVVEPERRWVLA